METNRHTTTMDKSLNINSKNKFLIIKLILNEIKNWLKPKYVVKLKIKF